MRKLLTVTCMAGLLVAAGAAQDNQALAEKQGCTAGHQVDKKLIGPPTTRLPRSARATRTRQPSLRSRSRKGEWASGVRSRCHRTTRPARQTPRPWLTGYCRWRSSDQHPTPIRRPRWPPFFSATGNLPGHGGRKVFARIGEFGQYVSLGAYRTPKSDRLLEPIDHPETKAA
jgi:hypothetical protein